MSTEERGSLMPKTLEERIEAVEEQINQSADKIKTEKERIKKLKKQKTELQKKLEEENEKKLSAYLKKNGIKTVEDFESLLDGNSNFEKSE